jgi:hypothetical protein
MPLVQDRSEEWEMDYKPNLEENDFFYKWHLCHEMQFEEETYDQPTIDHTADEQTSNPQVTDSETMDDKARPDPD